MQVSTDKTVILLALSGPSYDKVTAPFIHRTKRDRFLQETTSSGPVILPIKTSRTYLGVKNMAWARQGLTKLAQPRSGPTKLGSSGLAGSLGRLTHEANYDLHVRLGVPDPIAMLRESVRSRVSKSQKHLRGLQPPIVRQRQTSLLSEVSLFVTASQTLKGELTEVSQLVRVACSCNVCGQQFASFHALRTQIGKSHPERSIARAKLLTRPGPYAFCQGKPQCNKCLKQFSGWPAFVAHFNQRACPAAPTAAATSDSSVCGALGPGGKEDSSKEEEPVPFFHLDQTGSLKSLAEHFKVRGSLDKCPECGMHCKPMYLIRHACKQHKWLQLARARVVDWAKNSQIPTNPCQWCGSQLKTSNKAPSQLMPCALVLWTAPK